MVLWLICTIIMLLIVYKYQLSIRISDILCSIGIGAIVSTCIGIPLFILSEHKMQVEINAPIYAFEDNVTTATHRYYLSRDLEKFYYVSNYKDGKKVYQSYSNDSYIIETNDENPKVIISRVVLKYDWLNYFVLLEPQKEYEYKFYIPKGSVTNNFNLDLKN